MPFTVALPKRKDSKKRVILGTAFDIDAGIVFVLADSREIFVLTEDLALLGIVVLDYLGTVKGPLAFVPSTKTLFALSENRSIVAFGLDGRRKPHLELPRGRIVSLRVDLRGNLYVIYKSSANQCTMTCGNQDMRLPPFSRFNWGRTDDGVFFSYSSLGTGELTTTVFFDSKLRTTWKLIRSFGDSTPIVFHRASKTIVVERKENCALEAIDLQGTVKFHIPTFFTGNSDSFRILAPTSWGCVIRSIENDEITTTQLTLEPVATFTQLSFPDFFSLNPVL